MDELGCLHRGHQWIDAYELSDFNCNSLYYVLGTPHIACRSSFCLSQGLVGTHAPFFVGGGMLLVAWST